MCLVKFKDENVLLVKKSCTETMQKFKQPAEYTGEPVLAVNMKMMSARDKPERKEHFLKVETCRRTMRALHQVMLLQGMDPTVMNIFHDLISFELRMVHRRKPKQKMTHDDDYQRIVYLDNFLRKQLWHLGLVVLKLRKAAKAWYLRFDLIKRLSAVERFLNASSDTHHALKVLPPP